MLQSRIGSFTLIELLISIAILMILIVASIPMLSSDKEKGFRNNVQKTATFFEKAKNFSLNPSIDNKDDIQYRVRRSTTNFKIFGVSEDGTETEMTDERLSLGNLDGICGVNAVTFNVGTGSTDSPPAGKTIGFKKGAFEAGLEISPDGQIRILETSPCTI